jgi:hypothetical protein
MPYIHAICVPDKKRSREKNRRLTIKRPMIDGDNGIWPGSEKFQIKIKA